MSAFIVSHNHINAIVSFARRHQVVNIAGNEQAAAELLLSENTRSVNHRYQEDAPVGLIVYDCQAPKLSPVEAIKACNSLGYQSCESEDWESTQACQLLRSITSAAVMDLPGYEAAAWSIA